MNAINGLILRKSTAGNKSDEDVFIENKPIVLSSNVTNTQFVNTPVVFMTTYDQVGDGPKLWRGAKAGESVFSGSYTIADGILKYAGPETLGTNGKLNSITGNLLSDTPCSGYIGTRVNGNTIITEYLPVYFKGVATGYDVTKSNVVDSLTGKEVLDGSAIADSGISPNADFNEPGNAAATEDETDIDVLAALRVAAPRGATKKYFNINWGKTAAGFYTSVT